MCADRRSDKAPVTGAFLLGGVLIGAFCAVPVRADGCDPARVDLRGDWGQARFSVEIADTDRSRARGLMNRAQMPISHGMLFVYDQPQEVSFWMKNTLIPLDMLFLRADGTVARIHENARPLDLTPIPGGSDILAVLEVNGGVTARFGITEGSVLRHPVFDPRLAKWGCVDRMGDSDGTGQVDGAG